MLDSLVRVSRRVGWVTDLLAASLRPPTSSAGRLRGGLARPSTRNECDVSAAPSSGDLLASDLKETEESPLGPSDTTVGRRATDGTANNRQAR